MAEYIEREKVYKLLAGTSMPWGMSWQKAVDDIIRGVDNIPAADVAPVKHGHWIEEGDIQICSECGEEHCWQDYRASYCDVCGAKMDGEGE